MLFGGLAYWPIYMIFHRRWSRKARLLFGIFWGTAAAVAGLGGLLLSLFRRGFSIQALWPLQFLFPLVTLVSLAASFAATVAFDDEGNV